MTPAAALLAAFAIAAPIAPASDPLQVPESAWAAKRFTVKDRVSHLINGLPVTAVVYGAEDGSSDRLEAYVTVDGKAYLGYSHPSQNDRLELDTTPAGRGFRDFLEDGSRIIAYHASIRALNASSLDVIRYKEFHFSRVASFPEGRFIQDGDETLVLSRDLPLGRFLSIGCESFGTISQTAFRTRLYAPLRGRFVETTEKHPRLFTEEIARKEAALARLRDDLQTNAGEYLGLALSIYYDYAARGEARKGWDRQREFFQLPARAPASVRSCFESMRAGLRARLGIPADWP